MTAISRLSALWNNLTRRGQTERELDDEIRSTFELLVAENIEAGLTVEDARRAAAITLGGIEQVKEQVRDAKSGVFLESILQDLRYASRSLRKNPGFAVTAILTLALGIGANTAIFTLFHAILLKSLPVQQPERLVLFTPSSSEGTHTGTLPPGRWDLFSTEVYDYLRHQSLPYEGLAAVRSGEATVSLRMPSTPGDVTRARRAQGHLVSGNYFAVVGVDAAVGRTLHPGDDRPDAPPVAVVSDGFWKQSLMADPAVVGRVVLVNGTAFTIVGITPPGFFGERVRRSPDIWMPVAFQPQIELRPSYLDRSDAYWLNLIGRLSGTATRAETQAATTAALRHFLSSREAATADEERKREIQESHVELVDGAGGVFVLRALYAEPLYILLAVVGLVLLLACANVGNLLLVRTSTRRAEIAMRMALGATRARLVRQLITESLLLTVLGAVCGVLLARWVVSMLLVSIVGGTNPLRATLSAPVLAFTIGVTCVVGVLCGVALAVGTGRTDVMTALKSGRSGGASRRRTFRATGNLVVAQIAISLVLLVGASLFARSLLNLQNAPLGFDRDQVLIARISPRLAGYDTANVGALYRKLLERLNASPGVGSATLASYSPFSGSRSRTNSVSVEGYSPGPGDKLSVQRIFVAPLYPDTLGIPVVQGRAIGLEDGPGAPSVVMVNEAFVRRFFQDASPLGHRFSFDGASQVFEFEIVGVLKDAQYYEAQNEMEPVVYPALLQDSSQVALSSEIEVRTTGDPGAMSNAVRQAIGEIDPNLAVDTRTLKGQVTSTFGSQRLAARLVSLFGALAMLLASVGLYGVTAQGVVQRTHEIGIRMSLGADRTEIVQTVLGGAMRLAIAGAVLGMAVAYALSRTLTRFLYGIAPSDPTSYAVAAAVLVTMALLASYLPARRATRINPMVALRCE